MAEPPSKTTMADGRRWLDTSKRQRCRSAADANARLGSNIQRAPRRFQMMKLQGRTLRVISNQYSVFSGGIEDKAEIWKAESRNGEERNAEG